MERDNLPKDKIWEIRDPEQISGISGVFGISEVANHRVEQAPEDLCAKGAVLIDISTGKNRRPREETILGGVGVLGEKPVTACTAGSQLIAEWACEPLRGVRAYLV